MQLKYLKTAFDADKYNITEEELNGLTLEQQVELVSDKMQQFEDKQTATKEEYDKKAIEAFNEVKKYKKLRATAKSNADTARENRGRIRKEYKDNLPLIELKLANNDK